LIDESRATFRNENRRTTKRPQHRLVESGDPLVAT